MYNNENKYDFDEKCFWLRIKIENEKHSFDVCLILLNLKVLKNTIYWIRSGCAISRMIIK